MIEVPANSVANSEDEFTKFVANALPSGESIAVHHFAKRFLISCQHVRKLIESGEIEVPAEEVARARTKAKPWTIVRIPRESLIRFLRARTRLPSQKSRR